MEVPLNLRFDRRSCGVIKAQRNDITDSLVRAAGVVMFLDDGKRTAQVGFAQQNQIISSSACCPSSWADPSDLIRSGSELWATVKPRGWPFRNTARRGSFPSGTSRNNSQAVLDEKTPAGLSQQQTRAQFAMPNPSAKKQEPPPRLILAQNAEIRQLISRFAIEQLNGSMAQQLEVLIRTRLHHACNHPQAQTRNLVRGFKFDGVWIYGVKNWGPGDLQ